MKTHMRNIAAAGLMVWSLMAGTASAQSAQNAVVVELFTSQGCSSCPPADALLAEMGERDDVIPLALHVDYWDYIGWKDRFADARFSKRQKAYARAGGWRRIYTPQMIVNGEISVVGSKPMKVAMALRDAAATPSDVALEIVRNGNKIKVMAQAKGYAGAHDIHLVRYVPQQKVRIERGENAGHLLTYTHIVRDWTRVAKWDGQGRFERSFAVSGSEPVVVLVQKARHGAISAAARLR